MSHALIKHPGTSCAQFSHTIARKALYPYFGALGRIVAVCQHDGHWTTIFTVIEGCRTQAGPSSRRVDLIESGAYSPPQTALILNFRIVPKFHPVDGPFRRHHVAASRTPERIQHGSRDCPPMSDPRSAPA